ncbi:MAG: glycosyltransferase [Alphaproteobacteria bacterium]
MGKVSGALAFLSLLSLAAWLYLILFRGGFWRADRRLEASPAPPAAWPAVAAIVPARNEAAVIGRALGTLLAQDYPGAFHVVVVDDESDDDTAALARDTARSAGLEDRLNVVAGAPAPEGWTGKTWALAQGVERARETLPDARYLWFSDADIAHEPGTLRRLVSKAEAGRLDLVSLMALLDCGGAWARLLIPAFVFFFQKLYPFAWVGRPRRRTAGAAGGCMLLRRDALEAAGGLRAISGALIDDCALAAALKRNGPIWLGLATTTRSLRPYRGLGAVWEMVARSAFTQLRHSTPLLALTVAGMFVVYLVPPVAALGGPIAGADTAAVAGLAAWLIMAVAYRPTLKLYRQPAAAAALLPVAALLYTAMTVDSALRHWRGAGGRWKGRITAARAR